MTTKLCIAQLASSWEDPGASLTRARSCIRKAAATGASLVCFPEQFATGWDPSSHAFVQKIEGEIITTLRILAQKYGIAIVGSLRESYDPLPRNTAIVIDNRGELIARYAKCHLFTPGGEERHYFPGNDITIFRIGDLVCGLGICYDLRFPPLFRAYARRGVQVVIIPAAWPASRLRHWEILVQARAVDHRLFIIGVNTTGTTPVDTYRGNSIIAGPGGELIAQGGEGEELICATLDPRRVEQERTCPPFVEQDRRKELYHELFRGSPKDEPC
jgi:omega-amidase